MRSYRTSFDIRAIPGRNLRHVEGPVGSGNEPPADGREGRDSASDYVDENLGLLKRLVIEGRPETQALSLALLMSSGTEEDLEDGREEVASLRERKSRGQTPDIQPRAKKELHQWIRGNTDILASILSAKTSEARAFGLAVLAGAGTAEDINEVERALERLGKRRFG